MSLKLLPALLLASFSMDRKTYEKVNFNSDGKNVVHALHLALAAVVVAKVKAQINHSPLTTTATVTRRAATAAKKYVYTS